MPSYLTPIIGRDEERARVAVLFTEAHNRMVVITGSGGVGKTRLAVQVANDLQRTFRHGTRFLSFSSVPANADLDAAFAWQLGLRDTPHQSHRESIQQRLQLRESLLVIDNVEHLPDIADLLTFILAGCPSISQLVTSRAELGLYGEVVFPLQPLTVQPRRNRNAPADPELVRQNPAVRLFVERIRATQPDFEVTSANADDVLAICEHLGGVPLALELTASQMAGQTPGDILDTLTSSIAARPHPYSHLLRHRVSLHDTIRSSYDLLDPPEQQAFRSLSIMRGHWTIEDVLPLLTADMPEPEAISVFERLSSRSLLQPHMNGDGELRFVINPILRRFGEEMIAAAGEESLVADRHARRLSQIATEAEPHLTGAEQTQWLARLGALHEDFRMAHRRLMKQGNAIDALRMSTALWRYAYTRGQYQDVRGWIEEALPAVEQHDELRSRALNGAGLLANVSGDLEEAQHAHERALALASRMGQHREIAVGRIGLADVAVSAHDDIDAALRHLDIAREAYEHLGDARGIASVLTNQGNIEWQMQELAAAFSTHEQARVLYAQAGDTRGVAWSDTNTGRIAALQGRHDEAIPRLHAAMESYIAVGDSSGLAEIFEALAKVALSLGDAMTASSLAGAATALRESIDSSLKSPDLESFNALLDALEDVLEHDHPNVFEEGRRLSPEAAIALARSVEAPAPPVSAEAPDHARRAREMFGITPREHEVLLLVCEGLSDQVIADRLEVSLRTIHTHINQLLAKLEESSRLGIIRAAHDAKIVPAR